MSTTSTSTSPKTTKVVTKIGTVETDARDKTRKVVVLFQAKHAKYGKIMRRRTVLHVHDPLNTSKKGDLVEVSPCVPVSKTKRWKLVRVIESRGATA